MPRGYAQGEEKVSVSIIFPKSTKDRLESKAEEDRRSLSKQIVFICEEYLDAEGGDS